MLYFSSCVYVCSIALSNMLSLSPTAIPSVISYGSYGYNRYGFAITLAVSLRNSPALVGRTVLYSLVSLSFAINTGSIHFNSRC